MRKLIFFIVALLLGCSKPTEEVSIATKYWEYQKDDNLEKLIPILSEAEHIEVFKQLKLDIESFSVTDHDDTGVHVSIKQFCYPELTVVTPIVEVDGKKKVDSKAMFENLFKMLKSRGEPVKKYCYEFEGHELSGKVNGQNWEVKKIDYREIDWGDKKSISISLHPEECNTEYSGECKKPKLIISNLNLNGDGGNMNSEENVTIHIPPSDNRVISKGSYRVTNDGQGGKMLEISFKFDEQNYLNGFVVLKHET